MQLTFFFVNFIVIKLYLNFPQFRKKYDVLFVLKASHVVFNDSDKEIRNFNPILQFCYNPNSSFITFLFVLCSCVSIKIKSKYNDRLKRKKLFINYNLFYFIATFILCDNVIVC